MKLLLAFFAVVVCTAEDGTVERLGESYGSYSVYAGYTDDYGGDAEIIPEKEDLLNFPSSQVDALVNPGVAPQPIVLTEEAKKTHNNNNNGENNNHPSFNDYGQGDSYYRDSFYKVSETTSSPPMPSIQIDTEDSTPCAQWWLDHELHGGDLPDQPTPLQVENARAIHCQKSCSSNPDCRFFAFTSTKLCFLKSHQPESFRISRGAVSGFNYCRRLSRINFASQGQNETLAGFLYIPLSKSVAGTNNKNLSGRSKIKALPFVGPHRLHITPALEASDFTFGVMLTKASGPLTVGTVRYSLIEMDPETPSNIINLYPGNSSNGCGVEPATCNDGVKAVDTSYPWCMSAVAIDRNAIAENTCHGLGCLKFRGALETDSDNDEDGFISLVSGFRERDASFYVNADSLKHYALRAQYTKQDNRGEMTPPILLYLTVYPARDEQLLEMEYVKNNPLPPFFEPLPRFFKEDYPFKSLAPTSTNQCDKNNNTQEEQPIYNCGKIYTTRNTCESKNCCWGYAKCIQPMCSSMDETSTRCPSWVQSQGTGRDEFPLTCATNNTRVFTATMPTSFTRRVPSHITCGGLRKYDPTEIYKVIIPETGPVNITLKAENKEQKHRLALTRSCCSGSSSCSTGPPKTMITGPSSELVFPLLFTGTYFLHVGTRGLLSVKCEQI